jgi:hypothetical protein
MPRRRNRTGKRGGQKHSGNSLKTGIYRSNKNLIHDKRTTIAKTILYTQQSITEALGGDVSPQQKLIIDRASFKAVRCVLIEKEIIQSTNGDVPEDYAHEYIRWSHSLREDLKLLGMERKAKQIETIKDFIEIVQREEQERKQ